jgi:hypothetical protein
MHAVIADLRAAEAEIERIRAQQSAQVDVLSAIQARYYEAGAEVTRIEQSIQYTRELRQRQRSDLDLSLTQVQELRELIERDRGQIDVLSGSWHDGTRPRRRTRDRERVEARARLPSKRSQPGSKIGRFMRRPSRWAKARHKSNERASSNWRTSSGGCCSSRSASRPSTPRSPAMQPAISLETLANEAAHAARCGSAGRRANCRMCWRNWPRRAIASGIRARRSTTCARAGRVH